MSVLPITAAKMTSISLDTATKVDAGLKRSAIGTVTVQRQKKKVRAAREFKEHSKPLPKINQRTEAYYECFNLEKMPHGLITYKGSS